MILLTLKQELISLTTLLIMVVRKLL